MPLSAEGCGGFKGSAYGLQLRRPALFGSLACLIWKGSAYGLQDSLHRTAGSAALASGHIQ